MKRFFTWIADLFKSGKVKKALEEAAIELEMLRKAVVDLGEQLEHAEQQITRYKKQIKDLKAKLKEQEKAEE